MLDRLLTLEGYWSGPPSEHDEPSSDQDQIHTNDSSHIDMIIAGGV